MTKLEKIYASLPKIECKQKCQEACSLIIITRAEKVNLTKELNHNPSIKIDKYHHALFDPAKIHEEKPTCKMLDKCGNCSIYNIRPLICRLFGIVKKMQCPFGCIPERWLSDKEAQAIFKQLRSIR
jgi:Fe-S-cluster containining protein